MTSESGKETLLESLRTTPSIVADLSKLRIKMGGNDVNTFSEEKLFTESQISHLGLKLGEGSR